jgi:pyrimidine-specific ribonucleoside hydrolase
MTKTFSSILLFLFLIASITSTGHSGKARYHVIIDTDGGIDDLRAITLLLASKQTEVIGIYCSDGMLSPQQTALKVQSLLATYHHEGIPVGIGKEFLQEAPSMRPELSQLSWGCSETDTILCHSNSFIKNLYLDEPEKITILCLASLNTVAVMQGEIANFSEKTERILWFNGNNEITSGLNYLLSPNDYQELIAQNIPISVICDSITPFLSPPLLDDGFWFGVSTVPSRYAANLHEIHQSAYVTDNLKTGRMRVWDELAALYLLEPELFTSSPCPEYPAINKMIPIDPDSIISSYLNLLEEKAPDFKVFRLMPENPDDYAADIRPAIDSIILKNGLPEWRAGVLTNELHGHMGIYAIIGMKMGMRAREYFNIGLDDMKIISYAGQVPPLSCMNDGLQVSTGSTLGHGLIQSPHTDVALPSAKFAFKGMSITISLKAAYADLIRNDIEEGVEAYGLATEAYWMYIRYLAIGYWQNLNRNNIFNIE